MIRHLPRWSLVGLLWVALPVAHAIAGPDEWQKHMDAAVEAFVASDYAEAGKHYEAAVKQAEAFGADDPRLAESLNGLGVVDLEQGRYTEAEPLLKRALSIRETAFGSAHPEVIQSLTNLARLYQSQGRHAEADPLLKRVQVLAPGIPVADPPMVGVLGLESQPFGQSPELMEAYNSYSTLYQQGRYSEAEGERNQAVARVAGLLLRKDIDAQVTLDLLMCWNRVKCDPPMSDVEIIRTVDSIAARELARRKGST